jgi:acetolactate synthase-1/3 small subunit
LPRLLHWPRFSISAAAAAAAATPAGASARRASSYATAGDADEGGAAVRTPPVRDVVSHIVDGVAADAPDRTRTIAVLCDNESGVLSRVAGTLSARGFNIDSLTVSATNLPELARMTIVISDVRFGGSWQARGGSCARQPRSALSRRPSCSPCLL